VAVTIERLQEALAGLDPESRALLDLCVRRGMDEDEIAGILRVAPDEVAERRRSLLARLGEELGLDGREQCDELLATLPDLPPSAWKDRERR